MLFIPNSGDFVIPLLSNSESGFVDEDDSMEDRLESPTGAWIEGYVDCKPIGPDKPYGGPEGVKDEDWNGLLWEVEGITGIDGAKPIMGLICALIWIKVSGDNEVLDTTLAS